ncbi:MAG: hypothetical protein PHZ07_05440 [Patescibacteria group bacterium]|nr:hypothetical protein [Patescibacteria group bacterium]MDD4304884.1 hypothetical protein [Patescibacteria group bacterium]MDD4695848.1 hypothetical protein [Patescibacteria group bacterium]
MKYVLKTNKLILKSKENSENVFIYTGSPNKDQKNKGKLVILLEFPESTENPKELGNLLVQRIHKLYYNSTLVEQEAMLESILEEVNENLPLITEVDNNFLKKFKAVISIIYRQEVYFSPVGNISAWTTNNKELINIFDYLDDGIDKPTVDKIFTNILSGNIEPNQSLIFTTDTLFDYISEEKLSEIISENEFVGINIKLKELLYKITDKNFCSVFVKLCPFENQDKEETKEDVKNILYNKDNSKESIDKLLQNQKRTKDILTKGKSDIETEENSGQDVMDFVKQELLKENQEKIPKISKKIRKPHIKLNIKPIFSYLKTYLSILWKVLKYPIKIIIKISKKIFTKKIKQNDNLSLQTNAILKGETKNFGSKKPNKNTIILLTALLILIIFAISIFINNRKKETKKIEETYNTIIKNIEEKQEEYDLLGIYKDENQAKEKLNEISELINSLPQKTEEQKQRYNDVLQKFTEILNKIRKLTTVSDINSIKELDFKADNMFKYGDSIILTNKNNKTINQLNLKSKDLNTILEYQSQGNIDTFTKEDEFVYILENDKVIKINLETREKVEMNIALHPNYKNTKDAQMYGNRLYILDSESKQIYKHTMGETNFSKGENWIKSNTDISKATSITIDGDIYLGTSDGNIIRFYSGDLKSINITLIDPIVKNIDKIYTDRTIQEVYLMDNTSKRIVIINKDGALINQYYFPTIKNMNNFIVDGSAKKIYIQSENSILEFKF